MEAKSSSCFSRASHTSFVSIFASSSRWTFCRAAAAVSMESSLGGSVGAPLAVEGPASDGEEVDGVVVEVAGVLRVLTGGV